MGIDVSAGKVVTFNDSHELRVVTDVTRPIASTAILGFDTVSIFRRRRSTHDVHDGNPLIYALKGKKGFTLPTQDFREIYGRAAQILPSALGMVPTFDVVVPLPSSSNVSRILAQRVVRASPNCYLLECLEKATVGQALSHMPAPGAIPKRLRRDYKELLNNFQSLPKNSLVEMKRVKFQVRHYVSPIVALPSASGCSQLRVLLVDDVFGSGASLLSSASALSAYKPTNVSALTFMSRLR